MKTNRFLILILTVIGLYSCSTNLDSEEEAKKFLEENSPFSTKYATIRGITSNASITSSFKISFDENNVILDNQKYSYTLNQKSSGYPKFGGISSEGGYEFYFCGNNRYGAGGCIDGFISNSGVLTIKGDYISASISK